MFRDLYKKANEEIKGDRAVLDRAFLQAAQPERKKNPVFKYSFIGTAVAAVMVLGAVFTNPSVFTNRSDEIGKLGTTEPTESVMTDTQSGDEALPLENDEMTHTSVTSDGPVEDYKTEVENNTESEVTVTKRTETQTVTNAVPHTGSGGEAESRRHEEEPVEENEANVAVMSLEGADEIAVAAEGEEDWAVYEGTTEDAPVSFSLRGRRLTEAATEDEYEDRESYDETVTDTAESAYEVRTFSYMYDMSVYTSGAAEVKTEGFVNTEVNPVANGAEAVERAKAECTVEYDTADVYRDGIENVWKVVFGTEGTEGNCQSVYLNSDGVTVLVVYGE